MGLFLKSLYRIGIFWGLLKFQIYFGVLDIPDIFLGWTVGAGSKPTYGTSEKKKRVPLYAQTRLLQTTFWSGLKLFAA